MSESTASPVPPNPLAVVARFWLVILVVLVVAGSAAYWFKHAFNDQGYTPEQPIAFSHKLHAGDLHLDCRYCHGNAERGRHAGVPAMEVCLGCHGAAPGAAIAADKPEIQKLQQIAAKGSYLADAHGRILSPEEAAKEPAGVTRREGGMVHWNRVHRLPDFVYFSHQWHLKAGLACQTCHGPIETMPVVQQYSDLTMAWCLECHRRSNYVSPQPKPGEESKFTVGTANYAAIVAQAAEQVDPVVVFHERQTAGMPAEGGHDEAPVEPATPARKNYSELLAEFRAAHPELKELPPWRLADLPESHRKAYAEFYAPTGQIDISRTMMNAPTQCSTCHQ